MSTSRPDSLIGSVLGGRYEISARVDHGGTAVVYRAIDRRLGRPVAVKVIHSDLSGDPDYVERFDREARAAAILSHPNIVAVFDQGFIGDRPYIVMEYVRGQSLRQIIKSSAPLPIATALAYADEIAKAISAAHTAGIIHRDIKPENVLITNNRELKVTDFGLAKEISATTSAASQGVIMGSISYIAPEIPATGTAVKASDVYSTGIVLYEMLTGHKPHTGKDISQVLWKHMNEDVPAPSTRLPSQLQSRIPDYLDGLVAACTQRDPNLRWSNGRLLQQKISLVRRMVEEGKTTDPSLVEEFSSLTSSVEKTPVTPPELAGPVPVLTPSDDTPVHTKTPMVTKLAHAARDLPRPAKKSTDDGELRPRKASSDRRRRQIPRRPLVILSAVALVVLGFAWWLGFGMWTTIPEITGISEGDAHTLAAEHHLTLETSSEYSETVGKGMVIRTTPEAGERVRKSSTFTAYISQGPERYPMPDVVGMTLQEAEDAIHNSHLAVGEKTEVFHDKAPAGEVVKASQEKGEMLKADTVIDLSVSKGRQPIKVENFTGKSKDDAVKKLEAAGLKVTIKPDEEHSQYDQGLIAVQKPSDGTLYKGDTVELTVSKGPRMIKIPDVRMMSRDEANAELAKYIKNAKQNIKFRDDYGTGLALNLAKGTEPKAGTLVSEYSEVTIIMG